MAGFDEELGQIQTAADRIRQETNARTVLVLDKDGRWIVESGEWTFGTVVRTPPMPTVAAQLKESGFAVAGSDQHSAFIQRTECLLLAVILDSGGSIALVRLRLREISPDVERGVDAIRRKAEATRRDMPFPTISNEDIDRMFA